jgi:pimeloyl-ACP methyl ester carboxylesterase
MTSPTTTEKPKPRVFTAGRIVALVLIALVVLALGYAKTASGDDAVSVPKGAKAGDLTWKSCDYTTADSTYAAQCGTLVAPENRRDAGSRLIAIPVKRIPAESASSKRPVFGFLGGPGHSNFKFEAMARFAQDRDVVLVGYRGVDGSVSLDCPEVIDSREHSSDWGTEASLQSDADAYRACANRLTDDGIDLAGYSIPQRVDDIELVRQKLGYGPIDLVSESFGTRIALIYAWRYPKSIHRSVMVGANPPGHFLWDAETTAEQLHHYAALCAEQPGCLSKTPDLAASAQSAYQDLPGRWLFLPIKRGNVQAATLFGLFNATSDGAGPLSGPMTLETLRSADEGDASGVWLLSAAVQLMFPRVQVAGDVAAMGHGDADFAERMFASPAGHDPRIGTASSAFIWAGGRMGDAWPANPDDDAYDELRQSPVETLLINGRYDFSTPPETAARELLPQLPNGKQVVLPGLGHTEDVWAYQPAASTKLIETYLDSGRVDTSGYTENELDMTPSITQGMIAWVVLCALLGLATLTVVSLVLMPFRVHRLGTYGRKLSIAVRSVYVLVLGLGGWFAGALVALTLLPTVPLTDPGLAVISAGIPIAIALYFAWVNRDWSVATKATGFGLVAAGALIGGWLGFHAAEVPIAIFTAIVGAAAAGNLALVGLDIVWDRQAHDRFAEAPAQETLRATPSVG